MSSVQSIGECKKCLGIIETDFNLKTLDDYLFCTKCGYMRHMHPSKSQSEQERKEHGVNFDKNEKGGHGVAYDGESYYILENNSENAIQDAKDYMSLQNNDNPESTYLTVMVDGELTCLIGEMPYGFNEYVSSGDSSFDEELANACEVIPEDGEELPF